MKPNYPRGQRSHDEIINRNTKGILNRKRDFEKKISLLFTDEMDDQLEPR